MQRQIQQRTLHFREKDPEKENLKKGTGKENHYLRIPTPNSSSEQKHNVDLDDFVSFTGF
jgi:hypothetical protein